MGVISVGFVGAENNPIYLHRLDGKASLDLEFVLYSSLDVFQELVADENRPAAMKPYLGLLCLLDQYAVYGFYSNTRVKVMLVLEALTNQEDMPKDEVLEDFMQKCYAIYVDAVSNPFLQLGTDIQDPSTDCKLRNTLQTKLDKLIASFN